MEYKEYNENKNEDNQAVNNNNNQSSINQDFSENDDESKQRARRSKNDNDGRTHRCQICGKCYLSYPALYTHNKNKHNSLSIQNQRNRGRPRKDNGDIVFQKGVNPLTMEYFNIEGRHGKTSFEDVFDVVNMVLVEYFKENSGRYKQKLVNSYEKLEEYPLLLKLKDLFSRKDKENKEEKHENKDEKDEKDEKSEEDNEKSSDFNDHIPCDEVFSKYLYKVSQLTNQIYFRRICEFVILYREFLNIYKKDPFFTCINPAEDAPDVSNEFITEFLDIDYCVFDFDKEETIELTQNFCQWMYDSNYTSSKLTLINN